MEEEVIDGDDGAKISDDHSEIIYDISTHGADFDVDGLVRRFERLEIYKPPFQRQFVWTLPRASRFIESLLLGFPIPNIFLYREEDEKLLVIDGLQRLTTLHAFKKGKFPGKSQRDFKLNYEGISKRFIGKTYEDLEDADRRRFDNTVIRASIIEQKNPKGNNNAIFHIFDRVNTTSTPLVPQEMRAAIYRGKLIELLNELNDHPNWRNLYGFKSIRSKDNEMILRAFSMFYGYQKYEGTVGKFLNDFCEIHRNLDVSTVNAETLTKLFTTTIDKIHDQIGIDAFKLNNNRFNAALFDSIFVGVAKNTEENSSSLRSQYDDLVKMDEYLELLNDTTAVKSRVLRRMEIAIDAFQ